VAPKKRKPGRPEKDPRAVVALKGTREWKNWLDRFAVHCDSTQAHTIDRALRHYAEVRGFDEPPMR
jgi:hypothetical protein